MQGEKRKSGVLLPVSSLWGEDGIGSFGKGALEFLDILAESHQSYWQILPLHPTGYGDSPYQSFSAFALNPYFIDLEDLETKGLVKRQERKAYQENFRPGPIQYGLIYQHLFPLLEMAMKRFSSDDYEFTQYVDDQKYWLEEYALFMAIKESLGMVPLWEWPESLKNRQEGALNQQRERLLSRILFWKKVQYFLDEQWNKVFLESEKRGIRILGDMPLYVAHDSADFWVHRELFQVDEKGDPLRVAGCPPDDFCLLGQRWGNPLYEWSYHQATGYKWWCQRLGRMEHWVHGVRWDHFRGLAGYYSIPREHETAQQGWWEAGPGSAFLKQMTEAFPTLFMVAENLGFLTKDVEILLKEVGWPGMAVFQFAFDSRKKNPYLPHLYSKNVVAYTGTHDNDTLMGWASSLSDPVLKRALRYTGVDTLDALPLKMLDLIMQSPADLVIIPIQDWLGIGSSGRINTPGSSRGNWVFRIQKKDVSKEGIQTMIVLTKDSNRLT